MTYALETRGLTKVLGARAVLRGLDLQVARGETIALHGDNGAGKTTLLRCLANLFRPTEGTLWWFGDEVNGRRARQSTVGILSHESYLYLELTPRENLLLAARLQGVDRPRERVDAWLARIKLQAAANSPTGRLSRGMRQRLSLARALVHEPPLVLLDEPFAGLDGDGQCWLIDQFREWRTAGRTVCFTSHDERLSERLADRLLWLARGRWRAA